MTSEGRRQRGLAWAQEQREHWARLKAEEDIALLAMRSDGLTLDKIATRLGISRQRVEVKLMKARDRERIRASLLPVNTSVN